MSYHQRLSSWAAFFLILVAFSNDTLRADPSTEFFERSVRPLLVNKCFPCHDRGEESGGGLRLSNRELFLQGGSRGSVISPGHPESSLLIEAVQWQGDLRMPPKHALSKEEVGLLIRWVREGAVWPDTHPAERELDGDKPWSFRPVVDPPLPDCSHPDWCTGPVDRFILESLEKSGLPTSPPAAPVDWLRRVYFDLIGLPPTRHECESFLADQHPDTRCRTVDRLLSSPRYAERWGRRWLDVVRFAETNGFEDDFEKPNAYRFRDYVIDAFNIDLPYDQFVREQIAGDLLTVPRMSSDGSRTESPIGSGFWWLGEIMPLPFCVEDAQRIAANEVETQIDTYGKAFLGLTVACARCHDHKFDPISTEDYYAIAGSVISTTNVQQAIESDSLQQANRSTRTRLEAVDRRIEEFHARPDVAEQLNHIRLAEAKRIAAYLLASSGDHSVVNVSSQSDAIDPARIARWKYLLTPVIPAKHPFLYPWARLAETQSDAFGRRARALVTYLDEVERQVPRELSPEQILGDFESPDFGAWKAVGEAFGSGPIRWNQYSVAGCLGERLVSSDRGVDELTGRLVSPPFVVTKEKRYLYFLLGGGNLPGKTCVNVILHSQAMPQRPPFWTVTGLGDRILRLNWFDLQYYMNMEVFIEIVDASTEPGGSISADHFFFGPTAPTPGEFAFVHPLIKGLLRDSHSKEEFAHRLQGLCVEALRRPTSDDNRIEYQPWNSLREWLEGRDSPLFSLEELDQLLSPSAKEELDRLKNERRLLVQQCRPTDLAMVSRDRPHPCDAITRPGGDINVEGVSVPRGAPQKLIPSLLTAPTQGSERLKLAEWTISPANPFVGRVIVNRIWGGHFGLGLVASADNFGQLGDRPTHPELVDFLTSRFIQEGWSIKSLHREIVLSSTYAQSSRRTEDGDTKDPDNRLLHRSPSRRLEAEAIRDSILFVSSSLDDCYGGPSVSLDVDVNVKLDPVETPGVKPNERRRSVYLQVRRNHVPTLFEAFDFPKRPETMGVRTVSALPAQALDLLNSEFLAVSSSRWELESRLEGPQEERDRITNLFWTAFSRSPTEDELTVMQRFLADQRTAYEKRVAHQEVDPRSWSDLCHVLFNLSEFIYLR